MNRVNQKHAVYQTTWLTATDCPSCGVIYGMDEAYLVRRREDGKVWYCPNGHSVYFTESDLDRARKRIAALETEGLDLLRKNKQLANDVLDKIQERKRLERRAKAGVCAFCHRTFQNVARHMQTKKH